MNKKSKILLQIDSSRVYGRFLLRGIIKYAKLNTMWTFYSEMPYYFHKLKEKERIKKIQQWKPDGIIIREVQSLKELLKFNIPTILCTNIINEPGLKKQISKYPGIYTNCRKIGETGAEYFLEKGYNNLAFVGYENFEWSRLRQEAFCRTVLNRDHETFILNTPVNNSSNRNESLAGWLSNLPKPIAVMACNDDRGRDVINACKAVGLNVPEEIAVLGVDNDDIICEMCTPSLSSIEISTQKAGYEAAGLLDKMLGSEKPFARQDVLVEPLFIVTRQSTDVTAIKDNLVAESLNYIRNNIYSPLQVNEIVENACVSRRKLELRFRKTIGRSIQNEIRRLRVEAMSNILLETSMPVYKIAQKFGYTTPVNVSRFFKKQTGLSLHEYRKKHKIK